MDKVSKSNRTQAIAMFLLMINSAFIIILRIRKMLHNSMIGEDSSGFDWYMIMLNLIVIGLCIWKLSNLKKDEMAVYEGFQERISR
ncbi:MAG: hypothetical protein ABJG47_01400 [Ekhidna sp.]